MCVCVHVMCVRQRFVCLCFFSKTTKRCAERLMENVASPNHSKLNHETLKLVLDLSESPTVCLSGYRSVCLSGCLAIYLSVFVSSVCLPLGHMNFAKRKSGNIENCKSFINARIYILFQSCILCSSSLLNTSNQNLFLT